MPDNLHREIIKVLGLPELTKLQKGLERVANAQNKVSAATNKANKTGLVTKVSREQIINGQRVLTIQKSVNGQITEMEVRQRLLNNTTKEYIRSWGFLARVIAGSLIARGIGQITSAFAKGTQDAREFEVRIGELRTISQEADLSFNTWATSIERLSSEFARQPLDVAEGAYQALSNQIGEGAEAIQFMSEALRLAQITTSTTEEAVLGLTAALNAYDLSADNARNVSNKLFKIVELGRIRFKEISGNIGQVLIVANQLGISLDDVGGALTRLTIQGLNASKAQTGLRNVLLKLIRPTDAMKELFDEWGVSSGEAAIANFGFIGVLQKLADAAAKGNSELQEYGELFGRIRAITGIAGLESDLNALAKSVTEIKNAGDSADEALKRVRETIGFKLNKELTEIQVTFLKLGRSINKSILETGEAFGGLGESVNSLINWTKEIVKGISVYLIAAGSARAATLLWATANTTSLIPSLTAVISKLSILRLGALGTPGLIVAGFGFAALAVQQFGNSLNSANNSIKLLTENYKENMKQAFLEVAKEENKILSQRVQNNINTFKEIRQEFGTVVSSLQSGLNKIKKDNVLKDLFKDSITDLKLASENLTKRQRLEIIYQRLYKARTDLIIATQKQDVDAIKSSKRELIGFLNQYQSVRGKLTKQQLADQRLLRKKAELGLPFETKGGQIGDKATNLFEKTIKDLEKIFKDFEKTASTGSKNAVESTQKIIDKQVEQNNKLKESSEAYKNTAEAIAEYNNAIKESIGSISGQIKAIREGIGENNNLASVFKVLQKSFDKEGPVGDTFDNLDRNTTDIARAFDQLQSKINDVQNEDFVFSNEWVNNRLLNISKIRESYFKIKDVLPIEGLEEGLNDIEAALRSVQPNVETFEALKIKLAGMKFNLDQAEVSTNHLKDKFDELNNNSLTSINEINAATNIVKQGQIAIAENLTRIIADQVKSIELLRQQNALQTTNQASGGFINRFAAGGSVGSDSIPALLSPGESVLDRRATRQLFSQISGLNSRAIGFNSGGTVTNNSVGDVNISMTSSGQTEVDAREIAKRVRRELVRGTARLN